MKKVVLIFTLFLIVGSVVVPKTTHAFNYGDNPRWFSPNFSYSYEKLNRFYVDNFIAAIYYWDAGTTRLNFSDISNYPELGRVRASSGDYGNDGYNGHAYHYHSQNHDKVVVNTHYLDSMKENEKTGVFGHEIGHTLGLDHVSGGGNLMCTDKGGRYVYKPSSDDLAGANYLY